MCFLDMQFGLGSFLHIEDTYTYLHLDPFEKNILKDWQQHVHLNIFWSFEIKGDLG